MEKMVHRYWTTANNPSFRLLYTLCEWGNKYLLIASLVWEITDVSSKYRRNKSTCLHRYCTAKWKWIILGFYFIFFIFLTHCGTQSHSISNLENCYLLFFLRDLLQQRRQYSNFGGTQMHVFSWDWQVMPVYRSNLWLAQAVNVWVTPHLSVCSPLCMPILALIEMRHVQQSYRHVRLFSPLSISYSLETL